MQIKNGKLSVQSENIFPIIKQWLYSEEEIFIREIVSNAVDAHSKRKHLSLLGETEKLDQELKIRVSLNSKENILTISDQGIGMSAEELDKYINQIAYSGLLDFVEKYKGSANGGHPVIGHFGLGFYSVFMVAENVRIESLSCKAGIKAVSWSSDDGLEYQMHEGTRQDIGTDIILKLNPEAAKKYSAPVIQGLLKKYCAFMPEPIYFQVDDGEVTLLNDTEPLWLRRAKSVSKQEYVEFYQKHFNPYSEPLFWIHINMDYPFRLKGILFFPAETSPYIELSNRIRVYSKQVFVSDDLREMIPDFLFLLQGCLDCPDLPLNVSRSYLQSDKTVRTLSKHIVSKVADKLNQLFEDDLAHYESIWPKLESFLKLGSMQNEEFANKVQDISLLAKREGGYTAWRDLAEGEIDYIYDDHSLDHYALNLQAAGNEVYVFNQSLDLQWMSFMEQRTEGRYRFRRADASAEGDESTESVPEAWQSCLIVLSGVENPQIQMRSLGKAMPLFRITEDESVRRFKDLQEVYDKMANEDTKKEIAKIAETLPDSRTCLINTDNPLYESWKGLKTEDLEDKLSFAWDLALLARGELKGEALNKFMQRAEQFVVEN